MIHKIPTIEMSREEWLAERRKSLGGSDMGAVLGLNPYRSPYVVWAEKTGRLPETADNEAMRQGRDLEGYVAERFEEVSGKVCQRLNYILRSDDAPHLHANIDRRVLGEKSGLECKTASALNLRRYQGGEFPESYYVQCVSYLAVTGWERWYLAALVLNKAFFIYQITTVVNDPCPDWCEGSVYVSPEELEALKSSARHFWESYVAPDNAPPPDGYASTTEAIEAGYEETGGEVTLFGREGLLRQHGELVQQKKAIERELERIKQTLLLDMGSAERGCCGLFTVSHTAQTRETFDAKRFQKEHPELDLTGYYNTTNFKRFSIKEEKET